MNKLLPTLKKEKPLLKLEEVCDYISSKGISLNKINLVLNIEECLNIQIRDSENKLRGLCLYKNREEGTGHLIYFFGADNKQYLKELIIEGLKEGCWPKESYRRGRNVIYKNPEKLIEKLLQTI